MAEKLRSPFTHKLAWSNYRSRLKVTLSFLAEKLEDADDHMMRGKIARLIERNRASLQKAEQRLAELSADKLAAG